jgi:hypothetical protein
MALRCNDQFGKHVHKLVRLSVVALLCVLAFFVYKRVVSANKPSSVIVSLPCPDLTLGCGNDSIQVKTDHAPQVMRPFQVRVTNTTVSTLSDSIYVDFAMVGMSMGLNRYRLIQQADGSWQGDIILPVCVQGRSDWLMEVTASSAKEDTSAKQEIRYHLAFQATK